MKDKILLFFLDENEPVFLMVEGRDWKKALETLPKQEFDWEESADVLISALGALGFSVFDNVGTAD
jgi:hypothetical protein